MFEERSQCLYGVGEVYRRYMFSKGDMDVYVGVVEMDTLAMEQQLYPASAEVCYVE